MLKYFYYIWNLLLKNERFELFYHFGQCLLAAVIYTIIDWSYLIMLWALTQTIKSNIFYIIVGVQLFSLIMGLWYYFIKYKIMTGQNYFYKILSNRHYNYVLRRIAKNAPYIWIDEKSSLDLAKQLDSTEKGLHHIFSFITQFIRLVSSILLSIFVISWNYSLCLPIFSFVSVIIYYISKKNINLAVIKQKRNNFQRTNQQNSLIISDNISLLFDSIIHNNFGKIIKNIITFNNKTKNDQIKMYAHENRIYIKIGLFLLSSYITMVSFVAYWMNLAFNEFTIFLIASLLTYKCINYNINELLDMYADIRQTEIDFELLEDIWLATSKKRPSFKVIELPSYKLCPDELHEYNKFRFKKIGLDLIARYRDFFKINGYKKFDREPDNEKTLEKMNKYVLHDLHICKQYNKFISECGVYIPKELETYLEFNKTKEKRQQKNLFTLTLSELEFCYPRCSDKHIFTLSYKDYDKPLHITSSSHYIIDGASGSGKSTFLKVIRGILFKNKLKLELCLNDEKHKSINWQNISNSMSYCQQNSYSFNGGTIYQILSDNFIAKKDEKKPQNCKLMQLALNVACVDKKFKDLDLICTKKTISGGQKQRLIIAKTLYRLFKDDKQIIILDEVDAGLDIHSATCIMVNLKLLFKNRILFVVLHTDKLKKLFRNKIIIKDGMIHCKTTT